MKRFLLILFIFTLMIIGVLLLAPRLISSDTVKTQITRQIKEWTGRTVRLRGQPVLTVFPNIKVKLRDVAIGSAIPGDKDPFIEMSVLRASLALWPLLQGDIRVRHFDMERPHILLKRTKDGKTNWAAGKNSLADKVNKAPEASADTPALPQLAHVKLGTITIRDANVQYQDHQNGVYEEITAANLSLFWPQLDSPAELSGNFVWNGEALKINLSAEKPLAVLTADTTPLQISVGSTPLQFAFRGEASVLTDLQLKGDMSITTPSVRRVMNLFGSKIKPGSTFGPLSIKAKSQYAAKKLSLNEARIALDGNEAEGALVISQVKNVPSLQGTLAFDTLDLSAYLEAATAPADGGQQKSTVKTLKAQAAAHPDISVLKAANLDLRISSARTLLGKVVLERTAASAVLKRGRLELSVGEASYSNGLLNGTFALNEKAGKLHGQLNAKATNVQVEQILKPFDLTYASGAGDLSLDLRGTGITPQAALNTLTGSTRLTMKQGVIRGLDLRQLMTSLKGQLPLTTALLQKGDTPIAALTSDIAFKNGQGTIKTMSFRSDLLQITMQGGLSIPQNAYGIKGQAALLKSVPQDGKAAEIASSLPFLIKGPLNRPVILPIVNEKIIKDVLEKAPLPKVLKKLKLPDAKTDEQKAVKKAIGGLLNNALQGLGGTQTGGKTVAPANTAPKTPTQPAQ